jgi:anti-sigma factor ChrR (cupin superfamily)
VNGSIHELVSLYCLGVLDEPERAAFQEHLRDCSLCQKEMGAWNDVMGEIGGCAAGISPAEPPPDLKDRVMTKIHAAAPRPGVVLDNAGILLARSSRIPWRQILPDVEAKLLFWDRERHYTTSLVRIAPGGTYPPHEHHGTEEIFILSGDLRVAGVIAKAGDYCRAQADSVHEERFSETGCLFLVVASQKDRLLT